MTTPRYTRAQLAHTRAVFRTVRRVGVLNEIVMSAEVNLFNVSGPVLVTSLFGIATTIIAAAGTPRLEFTEPDGGAPVVMSIAGAIAAAVNDIIGWDGDAGVAVAQGANVGMFAANESAWAGYIILTEGVIRIHEFGDAAATTGTIDWYVTYLPLAEATLITAL